MATTGQPIPGVHPHIQHTGHDMLGFHSIRTLDPGNIHTPIVDPTTGQNIMHQIDPTVTPFIHPNNGMVHTSGISGHISHIDKNHVCGEAHLTLNPTENSHITLGTEGCINRNGDQFNISGPHGTGNPTATIGFDIDV